MCIFWLPRTRLRVFGRRTMRQTSSLRLSSAEFQGKFCPLVTLCVSSLLLRLKSKRKRTRKETTVGDLFSCWLPLLDSNQRHPVSTKLPNGQFGMFACSLNTSIPQAEPQTMPSAALCATICELRCRWLEPTKKKMKSEPPKGDSLFIEVIG